MTASKHRPTKRRSTLLSLGSNIARLHETRTEHRTPGYGKTLDCLGGWATFRVAAYLLLAVYNTKARAGGRNATSTKPSPRKKKVVCVQRQRRKKDKKKFTSQHKQKKYMLCYISMIQDIGSVGRPDKSEVIHITISICYLLRSSCGCYSMSRVGLSRCMDPPCRVPARLSTCIPSAVDQDKSVILPSYPPPRACKLKPRSGTPHLSI